MEDNLLKLAVFLHQGDELVQQIISGDINMQIEATARIRKMLSREDNPPIEQVIRARLVPSFISFLHSSDVMLQVSLFKLHRALQTV